MSPITTLAPSATSSRASSAPIPRAPPLISATLPSTRPGRSIAASSFQLLNRVRRDHDVVRREEPFSGNQRQVQRGPDTGRRREYIRDGIDDPAGGAGDRRVVVVALPTGRHDVHRIGGFPGDLDAV